MENLRVFSPKLLANSLIFLQIWLCTENLLGFFCWTWTMTARHKIRLCANNWESSGLKRVWKVQTLKFFSAYRQYALASKKEFWQKRNMFLSILLRSVPLFLEVPAKKEHSYFFFKPRFLRILENSRDSWRNAQPRVVLVLPLVRTHPENLTCQISLGEWNICRHHASIVAWAVVPAGQLHDVGVELLYVLYELKYANPLGLLEHVGKVVFLLLSCIVWKHTEMAKHDAVIERLPHKSPGLFLGMPWRSLNGSASICLRTILFHEYLAFKDSKFA